MMRYRIKTPNIDLFHRAQEIAARETRIFVASEGLLLLSTGDLSKSTLSEFNRLGIQVRRDVQYDSGAVAR